MIPCRADCPADWSRGWPVEQCLACPLGVRQWHLPRWMKEVREGEDAELDITAAGARA